MSPPISYLISVATPALAAALLIIHVHAASAALAPLDSAIAYWQFTGTGGSEPDPDLNGGQSSAGSMGFSGNTFTLNNPVVPAITAVNSDNVAGLEGAATPFSFLGVNMSGAGQELVPTANTSYSTFARVRYTAFSGIDDVFRAGDWSSAAIDYYALEITSGQARFVTRGSGAGSETNVTHATSLSTNTWYDITGVFDSVAQSMTVYVYDPLTGMQVGAPALLAGLGYSSLESGSSGTNTRNLLFFEAPSNTNGTNTSALIDLAAVWNQALTPAEVAQLSAQPPYIPEPSSLSLLGLGILGRGVQRRRRR